MSGHHKWSDLKKATEDFDGNAPALELDHYFVDAIPSGDGDWAIEIPEVNDGIFTQAPTFDEVEATARDTIALTLDIPPDTFDLTVDPLARFDTADAQQRLPELIALADEVPVFITDPDHSVAVLVSADRWDDICDRLDDLDDLLEQDSDE